MPLSNKDKKALGVCAIFLGVVFVYMCGIDPYMQRYLAATDKIADQEKKLAALEHQAKLLRPRQRMLRSTRDEVDSLRQTFCGEVPTEERLSFCIRSFQDAASSTGTILHSIRPIPVLDAGNPNFDEYRFELSFSGPYATVHNMLYLLETGKFLHRPQQMDMSFDKGLVNCRMLAERFFYKSVAERAAVADAGVTKAAVAKIGAAKAADKETE